MDSSDVRVSKPFALTSPRSDYLPVLFTVESKQIDRQQQASITKTRVDWDKFKEVANHSLRPLTGNQRNNDNAHSQRPPNAGLTKTYSFSDQREKKATAFDSNNKVIRNSKTNQLTDGTNQKTSREA